MNFITNFLQKRRTYFPKEEITDEDYFPEEYEDPFNKIDNVILDALIDKNIVNNAARVGNVLWL